MEINHIILKAQKLGLANMSGTWDLGPMWSGPFYIVNQHGSNST